jgi:hypothetical protein
MSVRKRAVQQARHAEKRIRCLLGRQAAHKAYESTRLRDAENTVQKVRRGRVGEAVAIDAVANEMDTFFGKTHCNCMHVSVLTNDGKVGEAEMSNLEFSDGDAAAVDGR